MHILSPLLAQRNLWLAAISGAAAPWSAIRWSVNTWARAHGRLGRCNSTGSPAASVLEKIATNTSERAIANLKDSAPPNLECSALQAQTQRYRAVIENLSQGVCVFDAEGRLILCNPRYVQIYRLTPSQVRPGTTLREIAEARFAVGTCTTDVDAYLALCSSINASTGPRIWTADLRDGRTIHICHQPMPDGGWVATHEDITELKASRSVANERISLQALIDWVPDYLWIKDTDSRFVVCNKALASENGRANTIDMIGLTDFDLHTPTFARNFRSEELEILRSGQPSFDKEEVIVDASGARKWKLTTKVPLRNNQNEIFALVGISRDITERKRAEALRDIQAQILEKIAMSAPLENVLEQLMLLVESQITGIFGSVLLIDESRTRLRHGVAPTLPKSYTAAIDGVPIGPKSGSCGTAVHRRETVIVADIENDPLWEDYRDLAAEYGFRSCWSTPILSHQSEVLGTFALYSKEVREPTKVETQLIETTNRIAGIAIERKMSEDRIHFMANHDALTGLPNRTMLKDRLSQAIFYARRFDRWVTVLFIDLDNFKFVNDCLGHNAGDDLLKQLAGRMVGCVRATDTVVRLGGDEFVIVLVDQHKTADLISVAVQKIRAVLAEPVDLDGHRFRATCSIGIANYPNDGVDVEALLANADAAMYRAKELGRDNYQFYSPELNTKVHERFALQEDLRNAVANSEFVLHYQPQVDLRTGRVFAVEALIRWKHPTLGLLAPAKFIPLAEETGLILPIGNWVLREACRQNKSWQDAGLPLLNVSVNISARQFREKNLTASIINALEDSGLEAKYLELELTESLIMRDVARGVQTMHELQQLGVRISIDDFGIGYSSLNALRTFPISRLKIDKSFVTDLATNESDKAVTSAVISLGKRLNLRVIAEGVETDEQVAFLRENNCDEMQGYLFSRPISAQKIEELLGHCISAP